MKSTNIVHDTLAKCKYHQYFQLYGILSWAVIFWKWLWILHDFFIFSLKYNKQQSETISSRASETQCQLQQEKESLIRQLEDGSVERDKLMEQLREAYGEKEKIEQQFKEHVSASNETNGMLNQNITALQKHEEELKQEK